MKKKNGKRKKWTWHHEDKASRNKELKVEEKDAKLTQWGQRKREENRRKERFHKKTPLGQSNKVILKEKGSKHRYNRNKEKGKRIRKKKV